MGIFGDTKTINITMGISSSKIWSIHRVSIEMKFPYKESYTVNSHWKMCGDVSQLKVESCLTAVIRRELVCSTWISMQILNDYSHTKFNTPVLVWSRQLSNFGPTHVTVHFSVTIDCVRFLIRRFPIYTYSMYPLHFFN